MPVKPMETTADPTSCRLGSAVQVRRIDGRIYITLGGVEHGIDDAVAEHLMWSLLRDLFPGETLKRAWEREP